MFRVTAAGKKAIRAWIGPPLAEEAITASHDPLRSRARFLELLSPAERAAWAVAALGALDEVERRVRRWDEQNRTGGPMAALLTRTGELDVRARRQWVGELARAIGSSARS